jgi:hypothetical protein
MGAARLDRLGANPSLEYQGAIRAWKGGALDSAVLAIALLVAMLVIDRLAR